MAGQKNLLNRRTSRQEGAKERAAVRAALTDQQQLDRLNSLFGEGLGAKKERARLAKIIVDAAKQKTSAPKKSKSKKKVAAKKKE
jgi:hypothetical protein